MLGNQIYSLIGNVSPKEKLINFIQKTHYLSMSCNDYKFKYDI